MYIMLSRKPPFGGEGANEIMANIQKGTLDLESHPFDTISENAKDLIRKLLTRDVKKNKCSRSIKSSMVQRT